MKTSILTVLFLIPILYIPLNTSQVTEVEINWLALQGAFKTYADYPSSENALKIIEILPDSNITYTGSKQEKETLDFIYNWAQFRMLERQVFSRDRSAVKLAFKLRSIADGGFSEDLNIMLGTLIRIDPELFLEELKNAKPEVERLDALLANEGAVYVDRMRAQCLENQLRIKSLETVKEASLENIRNRCIEILKTNYNRYCR